MRWLRVSVAGWKKEEVGVVVRGWGGCKGWWCRRAEDRSTEASRYECDEMKRQEVMEEGQWVSCASLCVCVLRAFVDT